MCDISRVRGPIANGGANDAIRPDFGIGRDFGFGVDERGGMNGHDGNAGKLRGRRFGALIAFVSEDQFAHESRFRYDLTIDSGGALHFRDVYIRGGAFSFQCATGRRGRQAFGT